MSLSEGVKACSCLPTSPECTVTSPGDCSLVTVYLTHSLIPPASCTDLGVADVEVPSVHFSTPLVADDGQVDHFQYIVMSGAWKG